MLDGRDTIYLQKRAFPASVSTLASWSCYWISCDSWIIFCL